VTDTKVFSCDFWSINKQLLPDFIRFYDVLPLHTIFPFFKGRGVFDDKLRAEGSI